MDQKCLILQMHFEILFNIIALKNLPKHDDNVIPLQFDSLLVLSFLCIGLIRSVFHNLGYFLNFSDSFPKNFIISEKVELFSMQHFITSIFKLSIPTHLPFFNFLRIMSISCFWKG